MNALRQRATFKFNSDDDAGHETHILDEQEQDALINELREKSESSNKQYLLAVRVILALSSALHIVFLFSSLKESPLLALFPSTSPGGSHNIPLPTFFTLLSLFLHLNLALLYHPDELRTRLQLINNPHPLSYQMLYTLAAVAPTLALFQQRSWQTTSWWCMTVVMIFISQTVMTSIETGNQGISELESMKYTAPGA